MSANSKEPSPESIHHFIDYTWKDLHHSRIQNWTGITVVTAFHFGILKIIEYSLNKNILNQRFITFVLICGALFCLIGYLITMKHQFQLWRKLNWIRKAQDEISVSHFIVSKEEKKKKSKRNKNMGKIKKFIKDYFWTVGSLMSYFYLILMIVDIVSIFFIDKF